MPVEEIDSTNDPNFCPAPHEGSLVECRSSSAALVKESRLLDIFHSKHKIVNTDSPTRNVLLRNTLVSFKNDRSTVMAAVQQNGMALQFASPALKGDRSIVLAAVRQNGLSLQFASSTMQNDKGVVLVAVQQNGMAIRFASARLKVDRDIVLAAVQQNGMALEGV